MLFIMKGYFTIFRYLPEYYTNQAMDARNVNTDADNGLEKYIDVVLQNIEDVSNGYPDSGYGCINMYYGDEQTG